MFETANATESRRFSKVCEILAKYNYNQSKLIPILQAIQDEYRYLPEEVITYVATSLDLSPARVFGVVTFYSHFTLEPKGKYVIKVCAGTACHVKGSMTLADMLKEKLSLDDKRNTTPDMLFTLETVSCLGACGLAPVMMINDDVYGQLTEEKTNKIIDEITVMESANVPAAN